MYINIIDYNKKNLDKNSTHNSSFEIYMQFFKLYDVHYFIEQLYSIHSKFSMFVRFKKKWTNLSLKLIKYI
jgi:hypothetical protein